MFKSNLEKDTLKNSYYRKVIHTNSTMQLVLMSLSPKQDIGTEIHKKTSQFIRVESGHGKAVLDGKTFLLKDGHALVIDPGTKHNIINTSKTEDLKLYTIYSPPEHDEETIQKYK